MNGLAWMDHEFFTEQLGAGQVGWDWFSIQLYDRSELMLFRLRHADGTVDPYSAGTYVDPQGHKHQLASRDFTLTSSDTWTSPQTHARYPIAWRIQVVPLALDVTVQTRLTRTGAEFAREQDCRLLGRRDGNSWIKAGTRN